MAARANCGKTYATRDSVLECGGKRKRDTAFPKPRRSQNSPVVEANRARHTARKRCRRSFLALPPHQDATATLHPYRLREASSLLLASRAVPSFGRPRERVWRRGLVRFREAGRLVEAEVVDADDVVALAEGHAEQAGESDFALEGTQPLDVEAELVV